MAMDSLSAPKMGKVSSAHSAVDLTSGADDSLDAAAWTTSFSDSPLIGGSVFGVPSLFGVGNGYGLLKSDPVPPEDYKVIVTHGGISFNLTFVAADNPTANFETDVENAAKLLSSAIKGTYTVNLTIGYGEIDGQQLPDGSAAAGPANGVYESYSSVRSALIAHAAAGDPNFNALPNTATIDGITNVAVWSTEAKALGFLSGTATEDDGDAGFSTDISDSSMVGVALHEMSHAMGRVPFSDSSSNLDIFEFTRFSAPGVYVSSDAIPGPASYFSIDGGNTKLADYGQDSDPSDFANPTYGQPTSNLTPNDAFNQYYDGNTFQYLSQVDLTQLDVLGFSTYGAVRKSNYDFNGDGSSDILWRSASGAVTVWDSNGSGGFVSHDLGSFGTSAQIEGVGDFNDDGSADILWRNSSGAVTVWDSNGSGGFVAHGLGTLSTSWQVAGVGDFNNDGLADILWRNTSGAVTVWDSNGSGGFVAQSLGTLTSAWQVAGVGDFNNDGSADILWRNSSGAVTVWDSNGSGGFVAHNLGTLSSAWQVAGVGDFNKDGLADILWRNSSGAVTVWDSNGSGGFVAHGLGTVSTAWQVAGVGDFNGDGSADILWRNTSGAVTVWDSNGSGGFTGKSLGTVASSWSIQGG